MTISKEERAELRRLVSQEPVKTKDDHATLQTAVVLTLDALDAADERISVLESENRRALELIDIGLAENVKCQGHLGRTEDKLNARIAELEAAAQWRPMDTAPRDGTKILMSGRGPEGTDSAVIQAADEAWLVAGDRYSDEALGIGHPEVVMGWLPIPALPEGGV